MTHFAAATMAHFPTFFWHRHHPREPGALSRVATYGTERLQGSPRFQIPVECPRGVAPIARKWDQELQLRVCPVSLGQTLKLFGTWPRTLLSWILALLLLFLHIVNPAISQMTAKQVRGEAPVLRRYILKTGAWEVFHLLMDER